jgi:hypothetical protein
MKKTLLAIIGMALLAGAGCGSSSGGGSDCDNAAGHMKDVITKKMASLPDSMKDKVAGAVDQMVATGISHCKADGWSKDMIDCVNKADETSSCNDKLTADQKSKLDADMMKIMQDMAGGAIGGQK